MSNPIKWCDETLNVVVGCSPVSEGCANCYAARMASRFREVGEQFEGLVGEFIEAEAGYTNGPFNGTVRFKPERLEKPFKWKKPRRIFVTSMGDLWHKEVTNEQIAAVFNVIAATPYHIYLDLTKRPARRSEWFKWVKENSGHVCAKFPSIKVSIQFCEEWPPPNYWYGVSVENQRTANERIPVLLQTPASKRFVSLEPCLGPVDLTDIVTLDFVIVGAETGPGKRPMDLDWARSVRDQCESAGVHFWFKKDSDGNETLDGVEHHPEFWRRK